MTKDNRMGYAVLAVLAIITLAAVLYLLQPAPTADERVGNAMDAAADGLKDAGRELDPNRTPGEKIGDTVKDVGDSIKDNAR